MLTTVGAVPNHRMAIAGLLIIGAIPAPFFVIVTAGLALADRSGTAALALTAILNAVIPAAMLAPSSTVGDELPWMIVALSGIWYDFPALVIGIAITAWGLDLESGDIEQISPGQ